MRALQALELVGVDQQQRAVFGVAAAARPFTLGDLHEVAAVVGTGQVVLGRIDGVTLARGVQLEHQPQQPGGQEGRKHQRNGAGHDQRQRLGALPDEPHRGLGQRQHPQHQQRAKPGQRRHEAQAQRQRGATAHPAGFGGGIEHRANDEASRQIRPQSRAAPRSNG
jgi:hypothetical protein